MQASACDWQICARTDDRLGESILWHPVEEALYWIDFYGPLLHRRKQAIGLVETWTIEQGETLGSLVFADKGRLVLAVDHGLHLFDPGSGAMRFFADPKNGNRDLAYNDGKVDRAGRYWLGTYDVAETQPRGLFYRVAPDGAAEIADKGFVICNGPTFSPDNRKLYFSDTVARRILRYDLARDGTLSNRQTFFTFSADDGMPDGLTVDSAGNVWCALYGGGKVVRIDARGRLERSLALPAAYVTSLCLGGPGLKTLFVTTGRNPAAGEAVTPDSGGAVFMRPVDPPGLPEPILAL